MVPEFAVKDLPLAEYSADECQIKASIKATSSDQHILFLQATVDVTLQQTISLSSWYQYFCAKFDIEYSTQPSLEVGDLTKKKKTYRVFLTAKTQPTT